jgi:hypothetical protein
MVGFQAVSSLATAAVDSAICGICIIIDRISSLKGGKYLNTRGTAYHHDVERDDGGGRKWFDIKVSLTWDRVPGYSCRWNSEFHHVSIPTKLNVPSE